MCSVNYPFKDSEALSSSAYGCTLRVSFPLETYPDINILFTSSSFYIDREGAERERGTGDRGREGRGEGREKRAAGEKGRERGEKQRGGRKRRETERGRKRGTGDRGREIRKREGEGERESERGKRAEGEKPPSIELNGHRPVCLSRHPRPRFTTFASNVRKVN